MYEENSGFDESSGMHGGGFNEAAEDAFSQTHCNNFTTEEQPYPQNDVAALEMELHHHLQIEQCFTNKMVHDASNWQHITTGHYQNSAADFNQIFAAKAPLTEAPDLPSTFPPPSWLLPNFSQISAAFSASSSSVVYDPLLALNLPPQPPSSRDLFHGGGVYTVGVEEREANVSFYEHGDGVFEFTAAEMGENGDGIKDTKQHSSEKRRRVELKEKYESLRLLVPDPSKNDRASIVADAIRYIKELKRTVTELKGLVERKRCARERLKRPKVEEDDVDPYNNGSSLRSSWLHRKSKNTEVDVRIVDDEITVKLVQQKRINCLLFVSKVFDELQLDLQHVAGGLIGDYYTYLFNSKICEGSIVYASAVANKLVEVVDKQYAAVPPTCTTTY